MKITPIGEARVIMKNRDSIHNYFAWPSAARLRDGRIAVTASGYRLAHVCPFGKTVISFSDDEGETYTPPAPIIDTPLDNRDGGVNAFGESGVVVSSLSLSLEFVEETLMSNLEHKAEQKEYAMGYINSVSAETREKYDANTFRISFDNGRSFGPIHKIPASSPHGPVGTRDGKLLWVGRLRMSKEVDEYLSEGIYTFVIDPSDGTYEVRGKIPNPRGNENYHPCEPYAIELDDGRYLCHFRVQVKDGGVFTTFQSVSDDGGYTWSEPEMILSITGGAPAHIMKHSSGALISTYGERMAPYGVKAMFSYDNGKTWDTDNWVYVHTLKATDEEIKNAMEDCSLICGVHGDIGYPATVELDDGSLLTVFYAHLDRGAPAEILQQKWSFENEIRRNNACSRHSSQRG